MIKEYEDYVERVAEMAVQYKNIPHFAGLFYGKMGIAVFLCQYSSYIQNSKYIDFAFDLIKEINCQIYGKSIVNYEYGLSGIGVAIEYLVQNCYIEADTDDILEDFDTTFSFFLSEIRPLSSINQILNVGKYCSYRINNTKKYDEIMFMIQRILLMIEMEIIRNSFCSIKTLLLLNSLRHVSDKANELFIENFKNISVQNELQWKDLHIKFNNNQSDKSLNLNIPPVIELDNHHASQQWIEQIMILLKSGNEVKKDILNLLLQRDYTSKYCLFNGQIGAGLTILSFLDKKHSSWFDLL